MRYFVELFLSVVSLAVALAVNDSTLEPLQRVLLVSSFLALSVMFAFTAAWESTGRHYTVAVVASFVTLLWLLDLLLRMPEVIDGLGALDGLSAQYATAFPALFGGVVLLIIVGVMVQSLTLWFRKKGR